MDSESRIDDGGQITLLLRAVLDGEPGARDRLIDIAYQTIHDMAERHAIGERRGGSLQPTELVHEAYAKVLGIDQPDFENRRHFFGALSRAMHEVLVDDARRAQAVKRGGGIQPVELHSGIAAPAESEFRITELDRVMPLLEREDPRAAEVIRFRCVLGMTESQIADVIGVSERTVRRDWVYACAFLRRAISSGMETHG